ncbi:hypothetical protein [Nocardia sp. NBC_01327]|uniref:hypothetical protein n=1 Tax=Nocardia sp. NBC_01327 TaxID=2903593 RepID=UPI002E11702D|nr:hypothetical protein OG326_35855 [Nocardia sp. NBC_01327]
MRIFSKLHRRNGFRHTAWLSTVLVAAACTAQASAPEGLAVHNGLAASFAELQAHVPGRLGLALMPVGGDRALTFGDWTTGIAWSTMKVPLAVAALRNDPDIQQDDLTAAITTSDNDAAHALWTTLGGAEQAAEAVERVLRETGDTTTDVADRHNPATPGWADDPLVFGATVWPLTDQVHFASRLPCLHSTASVVDLMGRVIASQSWGLGGFIGASFKGGWGPDEITGAYTVRQFGLIPTRTGSLAVALAAQPDSGTFDDAAAALSKMAVVLAENAAELTGGHCS